MPEDISQNLMPQATYPSFGGGTAGFVTGSKRLSQDSRPQATCPRPGSGAAGFATGSKTPTASMASLRAQFNSRSASYEQVYSADQPRSVWHHEKRRRARWTVSWLSQRGRLAPDARVLDAGCGDGYVSCLLAESTSVARVVGVDLSVAMIERATRRAAVATPAGQIEFIVGDPRHTEDHWDAIFSLGVVGYQPEPLSFVEQLAGGVRKDGWLILTVGNPRSLLRRARNIGRSVKRWFARSADIAYQATSSRAIDERLSRLGFRLMQRRFLCYALGAGEWSWEAAISHHCENVLRQHPNLSAWWAQTEWLVWKRMKSEK